MSKQSSSRGDLIARIGTFSLLIAVFSFIFFLTTDFADQPDFDWFFLGIFLGTLGFLFRRQAAPRPQSGRFSILRRMRERSKDKKEKKA